MKTRTAVLLCLGICCLSVLLPLGIFRLQDGMAADKNVSWTSSTEDIAGRYPVVASVYANFYQKLDNPIYESYNLSDIAAYPKKQQTQMKEMQDTFSRELNTLVKEEVLPRTWLELKKEEAFAVKFGTLSHSSGKNGIWQLNQVYRINRDMDTMGEFTLDKQTGRLLNIHFFKDHTEVYGEEKRKELAWNMIRYLGLDSIHDWTYTKYGYESYEAKVQVYCDVEKNGVTTNYSMGIAPLGQHTHNSLVSFLG